MKKLVFLFTLILLGQGFAVAPRYHNKNLFQLHHHVPQQPKDYELCGTCVKFADQFLNDLLDIILKDGVLGGCTALCLMLPVASPTEKQVCELLCTSIGFLEFIRLVQEADLDPIYYCEMLKTCEIKDNGDATITQLLVKPKLVKRGSTFEVFFSFTTKNGTGTGEVYIGINTQDGIPVGQSELLTPLPAGQTVTANGTFSTTPGTTCIDEIVCEEWNPGNYTVVLSVCNGQCGSNHPHTQLYDLKQASFNITV